MKTGVFCLWRKEKPKKKFCIYTKTVRAYCRSIAGVTAIEYGLIGAAVAIAITVSLVAFGDELETLFSVLETVLDNPND